MNLLRPFHDLEAPAAGKHAAAVFGEDGRDAIGVLLVRGRIDDARTCDPIGGHVPPRYPNRAGQLELSAVMDEIFAGQVRSAKFACEFGLMRGSTQTNTAVPWYGSYRHHP